MEFDSSSVALVTFHFNPAKFVRQRETYYEWAPTLGYPVNCYELVIGDDEPEIEGSVVLRGTLDHALWQKERMINLAVEQLPESVEFIACLDHDLVFKNPAWLRIGVQMMRDGFDAVQLFAHIKYEDPSGNCMHMVEGAVSVLSKGKQPSRAPGGAWMIKREWLRHAGGIHDRNIVGGGDAVWFSGITRTDSNFLKRHPPKLRDHCERWIEQLPPCRVGFVWGHVRHLWHGDRRNRQYQDRYDALVQHDFDPTEHIRTDDNGLLAWTEKAPPELKAAVARYFFNRREDG